MTIQAPKFLYESRLLDATPIASTTAAGYNVLNLRDLRPYTWWKPTAAPSTVTVDSASARSADYGMVYAEAGTYQIRGSTDNFVASDVLLGTIILTTTGLGAVFFASTSFRYWRLRSTSGTPAVAIALIGVALTFQRSIRAPFDPLGREPKSVYNRSMQGLALGSVVDFEEFETPLRLEHLEQSWVRGTFLPAWRAHLRDRPFVFAWDPSDHADELYLVTVRGGFKTPHQNLGMADLDLNLVGTVL